MRCTPHEGFCEDLARQSTVAHLFQLQLNETYGGMHAYEVHAYEMHANEMYANEMYANEMYASEMHA